MSNTAKEWLLKANNDFNSARHELTVPNYDLVCFLCQQCIEKMMKGILIQNNHLPPRTHNLIELWSILAPLLKLDQQIVSLADLTFLSRGAVEFRYPGEEASKEEADEAFTLCVRIRDKLLFYFEG